MLIRLNCCELRLLRKVSLTLVIRVVRMVLRSSAPNSVNMTPTTALFLYQPVTSVSRVDRESAERILSRAFSLWSDRRPSPISRSMSKNGFRERSVRFRSSEIILWKAPSFRMLRSSTGTTSAERKSRLAIPPDRRTFTTPSPSPASFFRTQEPMAYPEAALCFAVFGGVQNRELKQTNNWGSVTEPGGVTLRKPSPAALLRG